MSDPKYGEWEDLPEETKKVEDVKTEQEQAPAFVMPNKSEPASTPLLGKLHNLSPTELGLGAAALGAVGVGGMAVNQVVKNAISRIYPSESVRQYAEQNKLEKEKLNKISANLSPEETQHKAELRRIELAKKQEQLNREQLLTQQLQAKAGVAPKSQNFNVSPPANNAPVNLPNTQAPAPASIGSSSQDMANFATGVVNPASQSAPVSPAQASQNPPAPTMEPPAPPMQAPATVQPNPVEGGGSPTGQNQSGTNTSASGGGESNAFPEATNASTNATKESGNLTNPAENPSQGGVEQIKTPETSEKENKPTSRIRITKEDEERIKAIKEAGIAPTHQLTREEIAKQPMHSEMKKIVEQGNATIEANPELKSEIERLKAGHKIPEGFVWIPHMGSGDVHFINTHGFEKYRQFKNEELGGKPIGEYALNPKEKNYNPDLREKIKKFSERSYPASNIAGMPEMTGEQKGKAAPEETNFFGKLGKLKPVAKTIAGVGGVMMALSELAQAKQEARHGNPNAAIGRMAKVATGFAPLATFTNDTNSNEQEAMNRIRNQQSPVKGAVIPK